MRYYCIVICCFILSISGVCQQVLVPFKVGDKYGLSDLKGKLIISAVYDNVAWQEDAYFETTNKIILNDTLETSPNNFFLRKNDLITVKGLIYKGKEILNNEPFNSFRIYPGKFIIAKCESRAHKFTKEKYEQYHHREKFSALLNIYGKNVYPDNFKSLQALDTLTVEIKGNKIAKFILFSCENFTYQNSLFVYNIDKQEITDWLLKDVQKLHINRTINPEKSIYVDYKDEEYHEASAIINYGTGKFVFNKIKLGKKESKYKDVIEERPMYGNGGMEDMAVVEMPVQERMETHYPKPPFVPFYQFKGDSLFYEASEDQKYYINLPDDMNMLYTSPVYKRQTQPVIYQHKNKFGLIIKNSVTDAIYDSIFYLGKQYLVYLKLDNGYKCGVIDENGKIVVPPVYDSIQTQLKEFAVGYDYNHTWFKVQPKKDYSSYYNKEIKNNYVKTPSDKLLVFRNGKCGILSINNNVIIPVDYDVIASNGSSTWFASRSDYFILKKNNLYGITQVEFNKEQNKLMMTNTLEPLFTAIPSYYYPNYYSVKGLKLFALYNDKFEFKGFANEKGFLYSKQQN